MKKLIVGLLICMCAAAAWADDGHKKEMQALGEKIKNFQIVAKQEVPWPFLWDCGNATYCKDQDAINIFYMAKDLAKKYSNNFAAVYNYGLLIMSNSEDEGYWLDAVKIDEADKYMKSAQKLAATKKEKLAVYTARELLVEYRLFGPDDGCYGHPTTMSARIEAYRKNPDQARTRLEMLSQLDKLGAALEQWNYFEGYLICVSLNRTEDAQVWLKKSGPDALEMAREEERAEKAWFEYVRQSEQRSTCRPNTHGKKTVPQQKKEENFIKSTLQKLFGGK